MSSATQQDVRESYVELTGFQRDILWQLTRLDGDVHGLRIKESLEKMGYETVNHGRLYPNLDTLVRSGFVEKGEIDRRTNEYELTDEALQLLADRQSWERGEE